MLRTQATKAVADAAFGDAAHPETVDNQFMCLPCGMSEDAASLPDAAVCVSCRERNSCHPSPPAAALVALYQQNASVIPISAVDVTAKSPPIMIETKKTASAPLPISAERVNESLSAFCPDLPKHGRKDSSFTCHHAQEFEAFANAVPKPRALGAASAQDAATHDMGSFFDQYHGDDSCGPICADAMPAIAYGVARQMLRCFSGVVKRIGGGAKVAKAMVLIRCTLRWEQHHDDEDAAGAAEIWARMTVGPHFTSHVKW